jgi:predicted nucleotidyltransferase
MDKLTVSGIVAQYRAELSRLLGERLHSVVLYGSQARGDARPASDIDVLCVMRGPFDYAELIEHTSEATARISLEHEVALSRTFVTEADYRTRGLPFYRNVRREGVVV